jgi:hypothetical protein
VEAAITWRVAGSLSLAFLALAAASLALKAEALDFSAAVDEERLVGDLAATLRAQGFAIAIQRFRYLDPAVRAQRGACTLIARDGSRRDLADAYALHAPGLGPARFSYAGSLGDTLPVFRIEARDYLQRTLARLGIMSARPAPVAIFATPGCDLAAIDFSAISLYPRGRGPHA